MAYTHFRYIGLAVPTISFFNQNKIGTMPPGNVATSNLLRGNVDGLSEDARSRLERLVQAVRQARNQVALMADDNNTLKIFIAPEFFFRPENKELAYSKEEYLAIKDVLLKTFTGSNQHNYDNWLIICGTIVWKKSIKNVKKKRVDTVYANTCIYIRGNWNNGKVVHGAIEKSRASPIDGLPTGRHGGNFAVSDDTKLASSEAFKGLIDREYWKKHSFRARGIDIGLEICLEHAMFKSKSVPAKDKIYGLGYGVLKRLINEVKQPQRRHIKLQCITAGGMEIEPTSVVVDNNGYVLRSDGLNTASRPIVNLVQAQNYKKLRMGQIPNQPKQHFLYLDTSIKIFATYLNKWQFEAPVVDKDLWSFYAAPELTNFAYQRADNLKTTALEIPQPAKITGANSVAYWNSRPQAIVYYHRLAF